MSDNLRNGSDPERPRWLDDSRNVDRIVHTLYAVCALVFLLDVLYVKHPHFGFEGWFGFYAVYGFVACVALVLGAKQMRRVVMRRETYYEAGEDGDDADGEGESDRTGRAEA